MKVEVFLEAGDRDIVQRGLADLKRQLASAPRKFERATFTLHDRKGEMIGLAKVEM